MTQQPTGAGAKPAPLTSAEKQTRRMAELDAIARAAGWQSWSEYSTAVKRHAVKIVIKQAARPRKSTP